MAHNFKKFPELTNGQAELYYFESPHKQIFETFNGVVTKVTDGDTIRVRTNFRDFDTAVRFLGTNAPEKNEVGGKESKEWLERKLLGEEVVCVVDRKNRVGKWGRILARVEHRGRDMNEESKVFQFATSFDNRKEGKIPSVGEILKQ